MEKRIDEQILDYINAAEDKELRKDIYAGPVKINNDFYEFEEAEFFGGELKLYIPNTFIDMPEEARRFKYPSESRPEIIKCNNKILHYDKLDNDKVIDLMKKSDVGLLPTWADTYGYSVLEFQSCGCPVISSNTRALPEINNSDVGWLIEMPLTKLKEIDYMNEANIDYIRNKFINDLESIFIECIENRDIIKSKAKLSIERIKKEHSPIDFEDKITSIYENC